MVRRGQAPGGRALAALIDAYARAAEGPGSKKSNLIDALLWTIEKGHWQPGDRLPTERELTQALPLSLGTIQAAIRRLVDAGVVERKAGVGTHVTNLSQQEGDRWYLRFLGADGDGDALASLEILEAEVRDVTETGPWAAFLGERSNYIRIARTIFIANRFRVRALVYLDGTAFRPLLDFDLRVIRQLHIRQILHDRFNLPTLARKTRVRFIAIDGEAAEAVRVAPGTGGMALEISSYTLRDSPLCFQRFIIPPNDLVLDVKSD